MLSEYESASISDMTGNEEVNQFANEEAGVFYGWITHENGA